MHKQNITHQITSSFIPQTSPISSGLSKEDHRPEHGLRRAEAVGGAADAKLAHPAPLVVGKVAWSAAAPSVPREVIVAAALPLAEHLKGAQVEAEDGVGGGGGGGVLPRPTVAGLVDDALRGGLCRPPTGLGGQRLAVRHLRQALAVAEVVQLGDGLPRDLRRTLLRGHADKDLLAARELKEEGKKSLKKVKIEKEEHYSPKMGPRGFRLDWREKLRLRP